MSKKYNELNLNKAVDTYTYNDIYIITLSIIGNSKKEFIPVLPFQILHLFIVRSGLYNNTCLIVCKFLITLFIKLQKYAIMFKQSTNYTLQEDDPND